MTTLEQSGLILTPSSKKELEKKLRGWEMQVGAVMATNFLILQIFNGEFNAVKVNDKTKRISIDELDNE